MPEMPRNLKPLKLYAQVSLEGGGIYTQPLDKLDVLVSEIQEGDAGDKWTVELVAMTEEAYNAMPDFAGH